MKIALRAEQLLFAEDLFLSGLNWVQVAQAMGVKRSTLFYAIQSFYRPAPRKRHHWQKKERSQALTLRCRLRYEARKEAKVRGVFPEELYVLWQVH